MHRQAKVWVVDDDSSIRWVLERALTQADIDNESFEDADQLLQRAETEQPDVIISDIRMPGTDGLELLSLLSEKYPDLPIIITTAHSDLDSAVASYQRGAFEYLPKPFDLDEVIAVTERAVAQAREKSGAIPVAEEVPDTEIIGEAPAMQEVFRAIGRLAHSNITVLINGESGTGKELVARALPRRALSRVPTAGVPAALSRQMAARCSSTKSVICRRKPKPACCAFWLTENFIELAATCRCTPTCGSSLPRTRTWKRWSGKATSERTCFTA
jgi:DNA-binding NtrC family response regulator